MQLLKAIRGSSRGKTLGYAWVLVERSVENDILIVEEIPELVSSLEAEQDVMIEQLSFEFVAGTLTVSFLDDKTECSAQAMVATLRELL